MSEKIVKCRYSHCNHTSKELFLSEAVQSGKSTYYHKDCYKQSEEIKQVIDLFREFIDPMVVISNLRVVINNIIFNKYVDSEYLLFALKFAINNKLNLKHAMGLHYIIGYKNIQDAYQKERSKKQSPETNKIEIKDETNTSFEFIPTKKRDFTNIIKE